MKTSWMDSGELEDRYIENSLPDGWIESLVAFDESAFHHCNDISILRDIWYSPLIFTGIREPGLTSQHSRAIFTVAKYRGAYHEVLVEILSAYDFQSKGVVAFHFLPLRPEIANLAGVRIPKNYEWFCDFDGVNTYSNSRWW